MCDFERNDVVVCVDDAPNQKSGVATGLELRRNYTVDRVDIHKTGPAVHLKEVSPADLGKTVIGVDGKRYRVVGYNADRFRRVYRPDGSFISKLLEPVDLGTEVE